MMLDKQFNNSASQADRKRLLLDEWQRKSQTPVPTSTYRDQANIDLLLEAGRFAVEARVTGTDPAAVYPRIASGPWGGTHPVPPEEPLGYAIDAVEPVGEPHEVAASLAAQAIPDAASAVTSPAAEEVHRGNAEAVGPPGLLPVGPGRLGAIRRRRF
jgi:hypothetical protein